MGGGGIADINDRVVHPGERTELVKQGHFVINERFRQRCRYLDSIQVFLL